MVNRSNGSKRGWKKGNSKELNMRSAARKSHEGEPEAALDDGEIALAAEGMHLVERIVKHRSPQLNHSTGERECFVKWKVNATLSWALRIGAFPILCSKPKS